MRGWRVRILGGIVVVFGIGWGLILVAVVLGCVVNDVWIVDLDVSSSIVVVVFVLLLWIDHRLKTLNHNSHHPAVDHVAFVSNPSTKETHLRT